MSETPATPGNAPLVPAAGVPAPAAPRSRRGLVIGIVVGAVLVLGGIIAGVVILVLGLTRGPAQAVEQYMGAILAGDCATVVATTTVEFRGFESCDTMPEGYLDTPDGSELSVRITSTEVSGSEATVEGTVNALFGADGEPSVAEAVFHLVDDGGWRIQSIE